jgi:hypothetical protein
MLILFDSLPQAYQEEIGDPRKMIHILERFYQTDTKAVDFYREFKFSDGGYILDTTQTLYVTNASVLDACIRLKAAREQERISKGGSPLGIMSTICADVRTFNPVLKEKYLVEHSLPDNERCFGNRFTRFLREGYESLIHKNHRQRNALKVTDNVVELLNAMFGDTRVKLNYTEVARMYESFLSGYVEVINRDSGEVYKPTDFRRLSESTVYNWLDDWENRIGTHAKRSGNRQELMQKFKPYASLKKPERAGSIISVDDRQPVFHYAKGMRMWFYNAIDLGSEAFTTWVWGTTKEGLIVDFYRQMVRNYAGWGLNLPNEMECESSLNSKFRHTLLRDGAMFQHVRIEANNARGKRIEAYYKQLRYKYEKDHEGWLARPFALSEANQKGPGAEVIIPYEQIVKNCLQDIENWNNTAHSVQTTKTRWEVFMDSQHENLRPINYRMILPYIGYKTETSCNAGIVKLQSAEWLLGDEGQIYAGEKLINLMRQVEGENIDVYWLDGNDGAVLKALVYIGDRFICEALPKPAYHRALIEQTATDRENRLIMSKYTTTIDAFMTRQKNKIEKVTIIDHTPRTLNDGFKIPLIHGSGGDMKELKNMNVVKEVEPAYAEFEEAAAELTAEFKDDLNVNKKTFKKSMIDRF